MADKSYRKLEVWQRAMELVEAAYLVTKALPNEEKYGLASQLQRATISIAANVAEGYGRLHRGEYIHHLSIARGSLFEVETLLTAMVRVKLVSRQQVLPAWKVAQQVGQMLTKLIAALRDSHPSPESRDPRPETEPD